MHKYPVPLLFITLVLVACAASSSRQPATTSQASLPSPTSLPFIPTTPPALPTSTPAPATAAPTLTPTPAKPLPRNHPLVAYQTAGSQDKRLVLLNPSSGASWEFSFPPGAVFATPFLAGLSPDARYFVYYQGGTVGEYGQLSVSPQGLVMNILDLDTRQVVFSTPLLSPDFPADLVPLVEMSEDQFWSSREIDRTEKLEDMIYTMQYTLLDGLRTVAWSPDGGLLAYASQDPGPSSDLYFYGTYSGKSWQVTSEVGHVVGLTWAPISPWDRISSKIALETLLYSGQAPRIHTDILARLGTPMIAVSDSYFFGWHDDDSVLLYRSIDFGDPLFSLSWRSVYNDAQTMLWENSLDGFALDPDISTYMVTSSQPNEPGDSPGLYLVQRRTQETLRLSGSVFWNVAYWGSDDFAYAASAPTQGINNVAQPGGTYGISATGEMTLIDEDRWYLLPSPDGSYLAGYGPYDIVLGLRLFAGDGSLLADLSDEKISCLAWEPGSSSLAYQVGQQLYLWEQGQGKARLVAEPLEDMLDYRECGFTWLDLAP